MYFFQISELETEFEKLPPGKPQQTRFLRSQQDLKAKLEEQAEAGEAAGGEEGEDDGGGDGEEIDAYDLMEPKEVVSKLPKEYFDKIVSISLVTLKGMAMNFPLIGQHSLDLKSSSSPINI